METTHQLPKRHWLTDNPVFLDDDNPLDRLVAEAFGQDAELNQSGKSNDAGRIYSARTVRPKEILAHARKHITKSESKKNQGDLGETVLARRKKLEARASQGYKRLEDSLSAAEEQLRATVAACNGGVETIQLFLLKNADECSLGSAFELGLKLGALGADSSWYETHHGAENLRRKGSHTVGFAITREAWRALKAEKGDEYHPTAEALLSKMHQSGTAEWNTSKGEVSFKNPTTGSWNSPIRVGSFRNNLSVWMKEFTV